MDRYWLLTNTCYGNWLPGDDRGFVGQVREHRSGDPEGRPRVRHNLPGTPYDAALPGLRTASQARLKGPAIRLNQAQAKVLLEQFLETARYRGWSLLAVAIMADHFHLVVGVCGDPSPSKVLADFKSWGTRKLTSTFGMPPSKTWWTERGSKRILPDEEAIRRAIDYVLHHQAKPLITWSPGGSESSDVPLGSAR